LFSFFAAANFEGSTTGTNQYPLSANILYTGTNEMFRKGFQSWAASKRQTGKDVADLWESIPQLYQSHWTLEEGASWLQADVIPLESLGELWNECNGDKRFGSKVV
jgi:hypothetical protein